MRERGQQSPRQSPANTAAGSHIVEATEAGRWTYQNFNDFNHPPRRTERLRSDTISAGPNRADSLRCGSRPLYDSANPPADRLCGSGNTPAAGPNREDSLRRGSRPLCGSANPPVDCRCGSGNPPAAGPNRTDSLRRGS
jgi:hypothetical protein